MSLIAVSWFNKGVEAGGCFDGDIQTEMGVKIIHSVGK